MTREPFEHYLTAQLRACDHCPLTESEIREHWEAGDSVSFVAEICEQLNSDGRGPQERD